MKKLMLLISAIMWIPKPKANLILVSIMFMSMSIILILSNETNLNWMNMILLITFIGGLMIMFVYMTILSPKQHMEKTSQNKTKNKFFLMLSFMALTMIPSINIKQNINMMFLMKSTSMIFMTILILIILSFSSICIFNPSKSMKSN